MKMSLEMKIVADFTLEDSEYNALSTTNEILKQVLEIMNSYGATDIISLETGEAISANEIPRVLGILDGLRNNTHWEFK